MAETLSAVLQLELSQFTAALQTAQQQLQAFAQQTQTMLSAVTQQIQQLTQATTQNTQATNQQTQATQQASHATQQAANNTQQVTQAVQQQTQAVQQAAAGWNLMQSAMAVAAGFGIVTTLRGIVSTIREFLSTGVTLAVQMQSMVAAFTAIEGSAAKAQATLGFVRAEAQRIGVDFITAAQSFKNLEAAARGTSLEGGRIREVFTAITEAGRVMGLSQQELTRVFLALEQMISKGKVSMEELRRQLGNALPGAFEIAVRAMGVTTQGLNDMIKSGLDAEDFVVRFGAQVRKEFGPGVEEAVKTAAATFARFGTNMQDVARSAGEAILTILQPILDTINRGFELYNQARTAAADARRDRIGPEPQGIPGSTAGAMRQQAEELLAQVQRERKTLDSMLLDATAKIKIPFLTPSQEQIDQQKEKVKLLQGMYDDLIKMSKQAAQEEEQTGAGIQQSARTFNAQLTEMTKITKTLSESFAEADAKKGLFTKYDQIDLLKEKLKAVEKAIDEVSTIAGKAPQGFRNLPEVQQTVSKLNTEYDRLTKQIEALKDAEKAQAEAERDAMKIEEQRQALINSMVQGGTFKLRDESFTAITADLEYFTKLLATETGPRLEAVNLILANLEDARVKALGGAAMVTSDELAQMRDRLAEVNTQLKESDKVAQDYAAAWEKLDVLLGKGESTFQKQREQLRQQVRDIEAVMGQTEETRRALSTGLARIEEAETKKAEEEVRKQLKPWRELSTQIEGVMASAFEQILSGSKNIFESIRDAFIKLLARMAADAITNRIVIPVLMQLVGVGGIAAAGTGEGAGTGGEGGGGTLSTVSQILGLGSKLGGNSLFSSLTGQGTFIGNILDTPIAGILGGGSGGAAGILGSSAAGVEGVDAMMAADIASGGTGMGTVAGAGGATIGTALGGIGAGIGVGFIVSQLLSQLGLKGTGNSVLSGAAGGAVAGTIIYPGIGTIIGALVGALGGFIASLFGKDKPKPMYDPNLVVAGQVGFDPVLGLQKTRDFSIIGAGFTALGSIQQFQGITVGLNKVINTMFDQMISGLQGLSPSIQKALVTGINAQAEFLAQDIVGVKIEGADADAFKQRIEEFATKQLPQFFEDVFGKLIQAAKRIDPIVRAFDDIMGKIQDAIVRIRDQELQIRLSIAGQIKSLQEGLFSPAQLFMQRQQDLAQLQSAFAGATPAGKMILAPKIQDIINQLFELGKTPEVLGQDPELVRELQANLIAQLKTLDAGIGDAADSQVDLLQAQLDTAQQQVDLLTATLNDVEHMDGAITDALAVLQQLQAQFGGGTLDTQQANQVLLAASVDNLQTLNQTASEQLAELRAISQGLVGVAAPAAQTGSGGESFQHGSGYVPRNMWGFLHAGERVLRRDEAQSMQVVINVRGGSGWQTDAGDQLADQVIQRIEERGGRLANTRIALRKR